MRKNILIVSFKASVIIVFFFFPRLRFIFEQGTPPNIEISDEYLFKKKKTKKGEIIFLVRVKTRDLFEFDGNAFERYCKYSNTGIWCAIPKSFIYLSRCTSRVYVYNITLCNLFIRSAVALARTSSGASDNLRREGLMGGVGKKRKNGKHGV